jgi:hypothetical protein
VHKLLAISLMGVLGWSGIAVARSTTPQLISFQKLMRLTPQKRMEYVAGVAKILTIMEAQQLQNEKNAEVSWELREMREKLVAMFNLLPEAEAELTSSEEKEQEIIKAKREKFFNKQKDEEIPESTGTSGTTKKYGGLPAQHQSAKGGSTGRYGGLPPQHKSTTGGTVDGKTQDRLTPGGDTEASKPDTTPDADSTAGDDGPIPEPADSVKDLSCVVDQPLACTASKQEMDAARKRIGKSKHRECIFGGQFSTYKGLVVKANGCKPPAKLSFKVKGPSSCPPNQGMCNPYVMCTKYSDPKKAKASMPFKCLPVVKDGKADLTARCDAWYTSGSFAEGVVKCDPDEAPIEGKRELWNKMREGFKHKYEDTCASEADYKILFCQECQTMAKYVGDLNQKVGGTKCGDADDVQPAEGEDHGPGWTKGKK